MSTPLEREPLPATITERQTLDILAARKLTLQATAAGWVTRNETGRHVRVPPAATAEEAVAAAEAHLAAADERAQRYDLLRIRDEMQRGRYFHQPRLTEAPGPDGEIESSIVFDIFRSDGRGVAAATEISGYPSFVKAWAELIDRIAAGSSP